MTMTITQRKVKDLSDKGLSPSLISEKLSISPTNIRRILCVISERGVLK